MPSGSLERRVCPECGADAGAQSFCAGCGLNLSKRHRLPSRADWEAARTRKERQGIPNAADVRLLRLPGPRSLSRRALFVIGGGLVLVIVVVVVVLMAKSGMSAHDMEARLHDDLGSSNITCSSVSDGRFSCDITTFEKNGQTNCTGSELVEPMGDAYTVVDKGGDFASNNYCQGQT